MSSELHTESPLNAEFTLCGRAFDDIEDDEPPPVFATVGQRITCKECRRVIPACQKIRRWEQPL